MVVPALVAAAEARVGHAATPLLVAAKAPPATPLGVPVPAPAPAPRLT